MFIGIKEFVTAYDKILRRCNSHSSCQLVIFVSCLNIDALCASKMLSNLFKKQLIQLQMVPIFGYTELKERFGQLDDNISSVILIGCGGMVDLENFLEIDPQEYSLAPDIGDEHVNSVNGDDALIFKREIFVLDCQRPWNLDNLFGSQIITCFDDGTVKESLGLEREAYHKLIEIEEEVGDDVYNETGGDTDEDEDEDRRGSDTDEKDELSDGDTTSRKRSSERPDSLKSRKQMKREFHEYEKILQKYYTQGTTVSNSLSVQIYSLLSSIGETNLDYLWLCILGSTSIDTNYPAVYSTIVPLLKDEVKRLTPSDKSKTPDSLTLEIQPDYYLFLLRHTSLYDSFYYSNYVNAKFSLWNENGKKKLHKMFARMGIPLTVAQENWMYMENSIKRDLSVIFEKHLHRYGLQDIARDGFIRTFGYRGSISASEFVESITALLEVGNQSELLDFSATNNEPAQVSKEDDLEQTEEERIDILLKNRQKKWISNFWCSWDVLDNKAEMLSQGLKHATALQKSVFETGTAVMEKKMLKHLRIYRLCVLQDGPDLHLYRNPLTLLRLGNWIIEYCSESDEKKLLPLVLAALDENADTYLCAGIAPRYPRGFDFEQESRLLNNFTVAFQQIAAETGAKVRIDNFENSIIEIRKDDLQPFLERLTLSGLI